MPRQSIIEKPKPTKKRTRKDFPSWCVWVYNKGNPEAYVNRSFCLICKEKCEHSKWKETEAQFQQKIKEENENENKNPTITSKKIKGTRRKRNGDRQNQTHKED